MADLASWSTFNDCSARDVNTKQGFRRAISSGESARCVWKLENLFSLLQRSAPASGVKLSDTRCRVNSDKLFRHLNCGRSAGGGTHMVIRTILSTVVLPIIWLFVPLCAQEAPD